MKISKSLISILLSLAVMLSLFCMSTVLQTQAAGITYYVDSVAGSDSNNGTSATTAWKSLSKVNNTTFSAGSTILFKRGGKWDGMLRPQGNGVASNYITVSCYGNESDALPIISNATASQTSNNINAAFLLHNQNYWKVSNIEFINSNATTSKSVVYLLATGGARSRFITVSDCIIRGTSNTWKDTSSSGAGLNAIDISHGNSYNGFHDNITIENNSVYDCNGNGIVNGGAWGGSRQDGSAEPNADKNIVIRGNFLSHIGRDGILVNNCNAPLVEYNVVENSHSSTTSSYHVAIWPFSSHNALFQYNEAYNTKTTKDGQGFDCDYQCVGTTFQYNYGHDNEGGFILICCEPTNWDGGPSWNKNITVRYNIGQNNKNTQFQFTGPIDNTKIYNNTFYYTSGRTVSTYIRGVQSDNTKVPNNTQFYNNIFYNVNGGEYEFSYTENGKTGTMKNTVWKNNLFYGKHPSSEPSGENKLTSDPMFIKAGGAGEGLDSCQVYYLKAGSPALGAGVVVENISAYPCTTDFFGNTLSGTPNIGAYGGKGYDGVNVTTGKATTRPTTKATTRPTVKPGNPEIVGTVCNWTWGTYWTAPNGVSASPSNGSLSVSTGSTTNTNLLQIGTWLNGGFSSANMQSAVGNTGVAVRVKIDSASSNDGTPTALDVTVKLYLPDGGGTAYICYFNGVPVNGEEVICYFPFEDFTYHTDPSRAMDVTQVGSIDGLEVNIISDNSFEGKDFNNLRATISPLYIYYGSHVAEPETTTAQSDVDPTTQQPTVPTAATQVPIDTPLPMPNVVKPAKVKKVRVKTAGKKKVKVRWKKDKNATKYIIKYSYKKSMKGAKFKTVKKLKVTLKKLKSGKRVYVRVRGVNGKVKGKFSVRKSVKVK